MIDLSCDLGEAATRADAETELQIFPLITSANIACGGHTGDLDSMQQAVGRALEFGVAIGAHPSYPDRENFGRTSVTLPPEDLIASISEQITALRTVTQAAGGGLTHVKPHGALYNDAHARRELAEQIITAVQRVDPEIALVCSPLSLMFAVAESHSMRTVAEGFGDRRYRSDGSLVPRSRPDALLLDLTEAAAQAREIAVHKRAISDEGTPVSLPAGTLCIHSDMENAPARLEAIRDALLSEGVEIRSCHR